MTSFHYRLKIESNNQNEEPFITEEGEYQDKNKKVYEALRASVVESHRRILNETGLTRLTTKVEIK